MELSQTEFGQLQTMAATTLKNHCFSNGKKWYQPPINIIRDYDWKQNWKVKRLLPPLFALTFWVKNKKKQYLLLPLPFLVTPRQILQFHRKNAIFLSTTFSARPCIAVYYVKVKGRIHWLAGYCPFHPAWKMPSKGRRKYKCQTIVEAGCMSRSSRIANKGSACRSLRSGSLDLLEVISSVRVFVSLYFITCPSIWQ